MDTTVTVTEAARNLAELVHRARVHQETTILLVDGEPVARIVPLEKRRKTAKELAALLRQGPRLGPEEAAAFEEDLRAAREALPEIVPKEWD